MVLRSDWVHGFYRSMWVENLMVWRFWGRVENLDSTDPLKVATPLAQALCKGMKTYDPEVTKSNQTEFWQKMKSFAPEVQHLIMLKSRQKMKPIVFKVQHLLIYPRWVFNLGCSTRFSSQTPSLNTWRAKVWAKKQWNDEKPTPPLFLKPQGIYRLKFWTTAMGWKPISKEDPRYESGMNSSGWIGVFGGSSLRVSSCSTERGSIKHGDSP